MRTGCSVLAQVTNRSTINTWTLPLLIERLFMKPGDLKLLYVCTDFPYPPTSGGLVDMWNRIQSLHGLGLTLDVIVTAGAEPPKADRERVEKLVRRLIISKRRRSLWGLLSIKPSQTAIRSSLRRANLEDQYDVVLMHTEFATEILLNKSLRYKAAIIRVDNDEYAYYIQTAKAERSWLGKLYFLQEAFRIRRHIARMLPAMDMLWFISHDELGRYKQRWDPHDRQPTAFVPSAVDRNLLDEPSLEGFQVLFVGNLWTPLNREAVEWYIESVHRRLTDVPGYKFLIAGSTRGKGCRWLEEIAKPYANITIHFDPEELSPFYKSSAVFVNPMQQGAGVKLKTIEAVLRGLPVVSTRTGAEGSGLVDGVHYKCADTPSEFAAQIKVLLMDKEVAHEFVRRSQKFILDQYDQKKVLEVLLREVGSRSQFCAAKTKNKDMQDPATP
jgi:glycosyltransferase involved in cell wall biosynthesis